MGMRHHVGPEVLPKSSSSIILCFSMPLEDKQLKQQGLSVASLVCAPMSGLMLRSVIMSESIPSGVWVSGRLCE